MRHLKVLVVVAVTVAVVAAGCGSDDEVSSSDTTKPAAGDTEPAAVALSAEALDGHTFVSQQVSGRDLVDGTAIRLHFEEGRLSASAGCNQMGSGYEVDGTTIRWTDEGASTMMACEPELMDQDTWLSGMLVAGMEATLARDTLVLEAGDVTISLLDEQVASPDQPLVGTSWSLDSLVARDAVSSVPELGQPPTLEITDDGRLVVSTGCNRGSAAVTISDDERSMEVGPLALTKMACTDGADVEAAVVAVLDGKVAVAIDGALLTIMNGDRGLVYRSG